MMTDDGKEVMIQVLQEIEKGSDHKREVETEREIGSIIGSGHMRENDLPGTRTVINVGIGVRNIIGGEVWEYLYRPFHDVLQLCGHTAKPHKKQEVQKIKCIAWLCPVNANVKQTI